MKMIYHIPFSITYYVLLKGLFFRMNINAVSRCIQTYKLRPLVFIEFLI